MDNLLGMQPEELMAAFQRFIQTSDFGTGLLNPEQTNKFIEMTIEGTVSLPLATVYRMKASKRNIDAIGIAARQARKPLQGISPDEMVTISTSQNQLSAEPFMYPCEVTYATFRENIEQEGFEDTLMRMVTKVSARDTEDLLWNGDESLAAPTPDWKFLSMNDGLIVIAKDRCVPYDTQGSVDFNAILTGMWDTMPSQYQDEASLKIFCSKKAVQRYRQQIASRQTGLGDITLITAKVPQWSGIDVIGVPRIPDGIYFLMNPANIAFGIREEVTVERDRDIFRQVRQFAVTSILDFELAIDEAVVIGYDVTP